LAIVVEDKITIKEVCHTIFSAAPEILTGLDLFDVYTGKGVATGKKSLAFGLTLQNPERTLTDDEVDTVIANILSIINKELGATLRE
jgi:phenylalanyl-tRNA synthetase beta chain